MTITDEMVEAERIERIVNSTMRPNAILEDFERLLPAPSPPTWRDQISEFWWRVCTAWDVLRGRHDYY